MAQFTQVSCRCPVTTGNQQQGGVVTWSAVGDHSASAPDRRRYRRRPIRPGAGVVTEVRAAAESTADGAGGSSQPVPTFRRRTSELPTQRRVVRQHLPHLDRLTSDSGCRRRCHQFVNPFFFSFFLFSRPRSEGWPCDEPHIAVLVDLQLSSSAVRPALRLIRDITLYSRGFPFLLLPGNVRCAISF